jgi:3-oxoacyl-[acyl-carrier protein] reductase
VGVGVGSGGIETPMTMHLGTGQQLQDHLISRTALQRLGTADEVARTIVFLLSNSSSYITGAVSWA